MTKTWINRSVAILMSCLLLFLFAKRYIVDDGKLNTQYRITVALVYEISYPVDGGPDAKYEYCVNHQIFKSYESFNNQRQKIKVGDKFLLKYYPLNPKIARIIFEKPVLSLHESKFVVDSCQ